MRTSKTYLAIGAFAPVLLALLNLIVFPFWHVGNCEARVALFIASLPAVPIAIVALYVGRPYGYSPLFVVTGMVTVAIVAHLITYDFSVEENRLLLFRSFLSGTVLWSVCWGIIARRAATSKSVAIN